MSALLSAEGPRGRRRNARGTFPVVSFALHGNTQLTRVLLGNLTVARKRPGL